jgi:hypothetical protein
MSSTLPDLKRVHAQGLGQDAGFEIQDGAFDGAFEHGHVQLGHALARHRGQAEIEHAARQQGQLFGPAGALLGGVEEPAQVAQHRLAQLTLGHDAAVIGLLALTRGLIRQAVQQGGLEAVANLR